MRKNVTKALLEESRMESFGKEGHDLLRCTLSHYAIGQTLNASLAVDGDAFSRRREKQKS